MEQDELAEEIVSGLARELEKAVAEDKADAAVICGMVAVGDGCGGEGVEDVGVVGLGEAVVSAGDDGGPNGVEETGFGGAVPL